MVAMQSILTCRTSPEGSLMLAWSPSLASSWASVPALRQSWPPLPGCSSTLCTRVPSGMFRIGSALPGRMSACGPDMITSVGLTVRIPMVLGALHELDLVAGGEGDHRLLPAPAPSLELAHALPLALAGLGAHVRHLHVEDLLHRVADLHLVGVHRHLEGDHVVGFLLLHALLGHQRAHQHRPGVSHGLSVSCRANTAAFPKTTRPFCFTGVRPAPRTSLRPRVEWVPGRRAASSFTTAWCSRGTRGVTPNTSSDSSSACCDFPFASTIGTLGIATWPLSPSAAGPWSASRSCGSPPALRWLPAPRRGAGPGSEGERGQVAMPSVPIVDAKRSEEHT